MALFSCRILLKCSRQILLTINRCVELQYFAHIRLWQVPWISQKKYTAQHWEASSINVTKYLWPPIDSVCTGPYTLLWTSCSFLVERIPRFSLVVFCSQAGDACSLVGSQFNWYSLFTSDPMPHSLPFRFRIQHLKFPNFTTLPLLVVLLVQRKDYMLVLVHIVRCTAQLSENHSLWTTFSREHYQHPMLQQPNHRQVRPFLVCQTLDTLRSVLLTGCYFSEFSELTFFR